MENVKQWKLIACIDDAIFGVHFFKFALLSFDRKKIMLSFQKYSISKGSNKQVF